MTPSCCAVIEAQPGPSSKLTLPVIAHQLPPFIGVPPTNMCLGAEQVELGARVAHFQEANAFSSR